MDETEVQVEIVCWAQGHPEASTINWDNGNEPWVDFSGEPCTVHIGLGGLTWSIEVPTGYQTEIAEDGKRKRLWEPFNYHDMVILQSRITPFVVSVIDQVSKSTLELGIDLDSESCMKRAETLTEVLDVIYRLAKSHTRHLQIVPAGPGAAIDNDAEGTFLEEENDEHLFDTEFTLKWSSIAAQANHARDACAYAATNSLSSKRERTELDADLPAFLSKPTLGVLPVISADCSARTSEAAFHLQNLTLDSPPGGGQPGVSDAIFHLAKLTFASALAGHQSTGSASSDSDDEYTLVLPTFSTAFSEDSEPALISEDIGPGVIDFQLETFSDDSDSDNSDGSWEMLGIRETKSDGEQGDAVPSLTLDSLKPYDRVMDRSRVHCRQSYDDASPSKRMRVEQSSNWNLKDLRWCDITFNPASFSVECTLRWSEFMDNPTVATALGFSLEHPLQLEILPNKAQVDSLAWTGAVEVYASQHTDWHNHTSEEICGLLCLVPEIVQTYLLENVPKVIRNHSDDLFIGLLEHLVRRLIKVNAGDSCCVCGNAGDRPNSYFWRGKSLWPCMDSMCGVKYKTWEEVSSVDFVERLRKENRHLRKMEASLIEEFSYAEETDLKATLEVYGISAGDMNYVQMIRALARIELWNQKDPQSSALEYQFSTFLRGDVNSNSFEFVIHLF